MRLHEYLKQQRKIKYQSAQEFINKSKIDLNLTNYYYYERGQIIPKTDDLSKIIKALDLNTKFVYTLWLHEHLPDETSKLYFPLPELEDNQQHIKVLDFDINQITTISKGHLSFLTENRLLRLLLDYFYINPNDKLTLNNISNEFAKHKKKDVEKCLSRLIDFGYIGKTGSKYHALTNFLYVPTTSDYSKFRNETMLDMVKTSITDQEIETPFGKYSKGMELFYRRTLTREQHHYIITLMKNMYNELVRMPGEAGQEFNICLLVGAMYEK